MPISLPDLPYEYGALAPVISADTLELHHGAHHRGYVDKLNVLLKGAALENLPLETVIRRSAAAAASDPASAARAIFNNAAQAWNHAFYWRSLRPKRIGNAPRDALAVGIEADFGSRQRFIDHFKAAALGVFGSGWVWLVKRGGKLEITTTPNAGTPIVSGEAPLLVLDVWEHAYYLDYQSKRADYVEGAVDFLLDWDFAAINFAQRETANA